MLPNALGNIALAVINLGQNVTSEQIVQHIGDIGRRMAPDVSQITVEQVTEIARRALPGMSLEDAYEIVRRGLCDVSPNLGICISSSTSVQAVIAASSSSAAHAAVSASSASAVSVAELISSSSAVAVAATSSAAPAATATAATTTAAIAASSVAASATTGAAISSSALTTTVATSSVAAASTSTVAAVASSSAAATTAVSSSLATIASSATATTPAATTSSSLLSMASSATAAVSSVTTSISHSISSAVANSASQSPSASASGLNNANNDSASSTPVPAIAGAVGGALFLMILGMVILLFIRRQQARKMRMISPDSATVPMTEVSSTTGSNGSDSPTRTTGFTSFANGKKVQEVKIPIEDDYIEANNIIGKKSENRIYEETQDNIRGKKPAVNDPTYAPVGRVESTYGTVPAGIKSSVYNNPQDNQQIKSTQSTDDYALTNEQLVRRSVTAQPQGYAAPQKPGTQDAEIIYVSSADGAKVGMNPNLKINGNIVNGDIYAKVNKDPNRKSSVAGPANNSGNHSYAAVTPDMQDAVGNYNPYDKVPDDEVLTLRPAFK